MKPPHRPTHGNGQDRWLLSYADFVTLLLAFFVSMYAVSTVDATKLEPAASSLREAFAGVPAAGPVPVPEGGSVLPGPPLAEPVPVEKPAVPDFTPVRARLVRDLADALEAGRLELLEDSRGLVVSLPESATFAPASTEVTDGARELIARVAAAVQPFDYAMRIEGHTDDVPISTPAFRSNWELSTARASTVIRFLIERVGFDPRRLSAAGFGEYHPRVANDSAENRARNRRVDIVIVEDLS